MTESETIGSGSDRRGFMKGAAVTAAAAGAGAMIAGPAQAASGRPVQPGQFPYPLPPAGVTIPCSCYAANVPLRIDVADVVLDFRGGIQVHVETSNSDGLVLSIVGHRVTASHPTLGEITISQADTTATPLSLLRMGSSFPPTPEMLVYLDFDLTISNPPGGGGPITLSTLETGTLFAANVPAFPPSNQTYNLQAPIPLGQKGADPSCPPLATLLGFPVTVNHSP